jgi:hypothetical protein
MYERWPSGFSLQFGSSLWVVLAAHVHWFMEMASNSWVKIGDYLEQLLILDGIEQVLVEDGKFSQSQKLFWIINKVDELLPMIADAVTQGEWYQKANQLKLLGNIDQQFEQLADSDPLHRKYLQDKVQDIEELKGRLEDSYKRFEAVRERARSLRDGVSSFSRPG